MARVLAIGDIHEPVCHPNYLQFCLDLYEAWDCDTVVLIGDVIDHHCISFHAMNPNCPGPKDEYALAKHSIHKWYSAFPKAKVCIGNHDERPERLAASVGIPDLYLRNYNSVWGTKKWTWDYDFIIDGVYYMHGIAHGGVHPAWNAMNKMRMPVVMGHCHARGGVKYGVNPQARFFGLDTGCGIDVKAFQFAYGKHCKERPVLGAGIILDGGQAYFEPMPISDGEEYQR